MAFLRGWEEWKKGERQKEREGRREGVKGERMSRRTLRVSITSS